MNHEDFQTIDEAFASGDLRWDTLLGELFDADGGLIRTHKRTYRSDTNYTLGVVGNRYVPLQNMALMDWAKDVLGNSTACVASAGHLDGGRIVYVDFVLDSYTVGDVDNGDVVENHLLALNAHDSSRTFALIPMAKRLWCWNQLNAIYADAKNKSIFTIKHFARGEDRLQQIRTVLSAANFELSYAAEEFVAMERTKLPGTNFREIESNLFEMFRAVYEISDEELRAWEEGETARRPAWVSAFDTVQQLYTMGPGAKAVAGTVWGAFNAISTYLNHHKPINGLDDEAEDGSEAQEDNEELRLKDNLFGNAKRLKERAFEVAVQYAHKWGGS